MINNLRVISPDGEILKEKNFHYTDSMNDDGYRFPSHKAGTRLFREVRLPDGINYPDKGRLYDLSQLMVGSTNLIGYKQGNHIYGYTSNEICEFVTLKGSRGRDFMSRMIKNKVIKKLDAGYYMNPAFFMSTGQRLSLELFINFQEELIPLLPKWVIGEFLAKAKIKQV